MMKHIHLTSVIATSLCLACSSYGKIWAFSTMGMKPRLGNVNTSTENIAKPKHSLGNVVAPNAGLGTIASPLSESRPNQATLEMWRRSAALADPEGLKATGKIREEANRAAEEGRYSDALSGYEQERRQYLSAGYNRLTCSSEEIECNFKLGNYRRVVDLYIAGAPQKGETMSAVALSYLNLGDVETAKALYSPHLAIPYSVARGEYAKFIPAADSLAALEGGFRLIRGMNMCSLSKYKLAVEELEEASKLLPGHPLVAYYLGYSLRHLGRYSEAANCIPATRQLGGAMTEIAKSFGDPPQSVGGHIQSGRP